MSRNNHNILKTVTLTRKLEGEISKFLSNQHNQEEEFLQIKKDLKELKKLLRGNNI